MRIGPKEARPGNNVGFFGFAFPFVCFQFITVDAGICSGNKRFIGLIPEIRFRLVGLVSIGKINN